MRVSGVSREPLQSPFYYGRVQTITGVNPPAGAQPADIVVPAGQRWLLLQMAVHLVTDVTVINRAVYAGIQFSPDAIGFAWSQEPQRAQVASEDIFYGWWAVDQVLVRERPNVFASIDMIGRLDFPQPVILGAGSRLNIFGSNLQAGDNFGALSALYILLP